MNRSVALRNQKYFLNYLIIYGRCFEVLEKVLMKDIFDIHSKFQKLHTIISFELFFFNIIHFNLVFRHKNSDKLN